VYVAEAENQGEGHVPTIDFYDLETWTQPRFGRSVRLHLRAGHPHSERVQESVSLVSSSIRERPCRILYAIPPPFTTERAICDPCRDSGDERTRVSE